MAGLRLKQSGIECPHDGFYVWSIYSSVIDLNTGRSEEKLEGTVCPMHEQRRWVQLLPNVEKFEPIPKAYKNEDRNDHRPPKADE